MFENEINKGDLECFIINNRKMGAKKDRNPKLLLFYKSHSNPLNIIYSSKLDCIYSQNHIEKRGKYKDLNIKSPRFKDNSNEWTPSRLLECRNNNSDCLKDINLFIWSIILKDIPKWAQVENLMNSYFNSIDFTLFYPSLELVKASFSTDLQEILFKIVTLSKKYPELSRAASNSISILSKLGYSLNNKDLQSASIPYSDLSHTLIINTNFQNSNLNFANFSESSLHNVNFKNCKLENAKFSSNLPFITYKNIGARFDFSNCGGYFVAFGCENEEVIRIWEIALNILIKEINIGDLKLIYLLKFSPSGQYITIVKSGIVTLFDQQNDYQITTFEGFRKHAICVAFSSCETYIAAGSFDNSIRVWYLKSKELIHNLCGYEVVGIIFSPCNNYFYSVGNNNNKGSFILVWAVLKKKIAVPIYKGDTLISIKFKKGKKLLKRIKVEDWIRSIALANNGKFIICFSTNISIWNINLGEKIFCYSPSYYILSAVSFNLINLLAIRTDDGRFLVFNIETQQFIYENYWEAGKVFKQLVFLPNGKSIAAASEEKGISIFSVSDQSNNKSMMQSKSIVNSISFSPCWKYFVTHCGKGRIELWDFALNRFIKCIEGNFPNSAANIVMYSSCGTYIATPKYQWIFIYSPDLEFLNQLWNGNSYIKALAITYDEKLIASGDMSNKVTLWKVEDLKKSIVKIRQLNIMLNNIK